MKLSFYSTNKKINSFVRPDEDQSNTMVSQFNATFLKETDISMSTPTFYIAANNFPETSYCILENFQAPDGTGLINRPRKLYYWITDIIADHTNRWYIKCKIDILATWKEKILSNRAFVEYSSSNYSSDIIDTRYPTKESLYEYVSPGFSVAAAGGGGTYILGVLNNENSGDMVTYYAMTQENFNAFKSWLFSDNIITELRQKFGSINRCIISCMYLPIARGEIAGLTGTWMQIGNMTVDEVGTVLRVSPRTLVSNVSGTQTLNILHGSSDFRKAFELHTLFLPYVGLIPLSAKDLYNENHLNIVYAINVITGEISYRIQCGAGNAMIATYSGQVGIQMAVSEYQTFDAVAAVKSLVTTVGLGVIAAVASGPMALGAAAGGITAGINTALSGITATSSQIGSQSGSTASVIGTTVRLYTRCFEIPEAPTSRIDIDGGPCFKTLTLNTLSGYCKTRGLHINNTGYLTLLEQMDVEKMINEQGVYI